ncbi:asparaginase [Bacillus sp. 2205SS5-2]|uniref:asparaginase n=1 Tax=Bacillus sp. 2205SS5-2 TaxID=3109031 RepID=UPI003006E8E5
MKKKILILHTGGTISMMEDETSGAVRPGERNPLTSQLQTLTRIANLIEREPLHVPSPHMTPNEMILLKEIIEKSYKEDKIEGVVITHGTDTLEETAYFLDLTVSLSLPIVVTGAMRSSNEIGSDGLYNLISSLRVAISDDAQDKGVLVVLNDEIHTAKNVTKTHTSNLATFQSPQYGPIGIVTKQSILFHHHPVVKEKYEKVLVQHKVGLLKAYAGLESDIIKAMKDYGYEGVIVEALGQGNLPPTCLDGISYLISAGIPVVLVSRCFNGIVQDVYGYSGGGKQLKEMGVIFSNGLNGQKARIKLLISLSQTKDISSINAIFQK